LVPNWKCDEFDVCIRFIQLLEGADLVRLQAGLGQPADTDRQFELPDMRSNVWSLRTASTLHAG
jgi:hypothetical protein